MANHPLTSEQLSRWQEEGDISKQFARNLLTRAQRGEWNRVEKSVGVFLDQYNQDGARAYYFLQEHYESVVGLERMRARSAHPRGVFSLVLAWYRGVRGDELQSRIVACGDNDNVGAAELFFYGEKNYFYKRSRDVLFQERFDWVAREMINATDFGPKLADGGHAYFSLLRHWATGRPMEWQIKNKYYKERLISWPSSTFHEFFPDAMEDLATYAEEKKRIDEAHNGFSALFSAPHKEDYDRNEFDDDDDPPMPDADEDEFAQFVQGRNAFYEYAVDYLRSRRWPDALEYGVQEIALDDASVSPQKLWELRPKPRRKLPG